MIRLEVTQRSMRISMEVTVIELGTMKGKKILEFSVTMYITIGNTLFKKRVNYLVIHKAGPSTTQLSYFLLSRNQRKCLKDIKLLPSIDFITQHNTVV